MLYLVDRFETPAGLFDLGQNLLSGIVVAREAELGRLIPGLVSGFVEVSGVGLGGFESPHDVAIIGDSTHENRPIGLFDLGSHAASWYDGDMAVSVRSALPGVKRALPWIGVAAGAAALSWADRRVHRRRPKLPKLPPPPDVIDVVDEPEPADIEYDNRAPCPLPDLEANPAGEPDEGGSCIAPFQVAPKGVGIPFAEGSVEPEWPVLTEHDRQYQVSYKDVRDKWHGKWGRHFAASRRSSAGVQRRHSGVDLFGNEGDIVVAMEPGEIIAILPFYHGAWAVYELTDSGIVINYGEVEKHSWREFGIEVGARVRAGDPLARLGKMREDTMLHVETYRGDTSVDEIRRGEMQWSTGERPEKVLDPTEQLVLASWRAQGALDT